MDIMASGGGKKNTSSHNVFVTFGTADVHLCRFIVVGTIWCIMTVFI